MPQGYSDEELFRAAQAAEAAGDTEAARKLTQALLAGKTQDQIETLAANLGQTIDKKALSQNIASRDAGGPVNQFVTGAMAPFTQTQGSGYTGDSGGPRDLGTTATNTAVGMAQGAAEAVIDFPLGVASGVQSGANALLDVAIGGGLDVIGLDGAADWWRNTGRVEEQRRAQLTSPVANSVNALAPAPAGFETQRDIARFGGGMLVPLGPKSKAPIRAPAPVVPANAKQQIVDAGKEFGVRVMNTDVNPPRGFIGKTVRSVGERIPFAGTGGPRVRQAQERVDAVLDVAREYGVSGTDDFIADVSKDFAKTRGKLLQGLSNRKNRVIKNTPGRFVGNESVKAIDDNIARLNRQNVGNKFDPLIKELRDFRKALTDGRSLADVEVARKLLGEAMDNPNLANIRKTGQDAINGIYAPLRNDMGAFIKQNAGDAAFSKWKGANERLAKMVGDLDDSAFKRALQGADVTPENVVNLLFSKKPSEVRRLYSSLSASGKTKAQSALIYEAMRRSGNLEEGSRALADDISAQRFAKALDGLAKPIGVMFDEADRASIAGLSRLLKATQQASVAAAAPPTGVQNSVPILTVLLADLGGGAGGATAIGTMAGLAARFYESATVRNLMMSLSKTKPGSKAENAVLERIARVAAPSFNAARENLGRAVNDNTAGALAAQEQQPQENQ